ncbi:hypothetical protein EB796_009411 [Bugula neritina]|uniref:Uncharacterized protein n=1 Tax=Bugula neritina TaxID=10212 RepID=A0A7J7K294_BUGNE|nr:hypothetical protein EB796_009411 [Bugula neritina]
MSDNDLENLLSNFTTPKLTHSSSTHPRDSTSSNRVVLGSIQPDSHQLPAEPQAKEGEKKGLDEGSHQVETSFTELHKRYDQMRQLMVAVWQRERA